MLRNQLAVDDKIQARMLKNLHTYLEKLGLCEFEQKLKVSESAKQADSEAFSFALLLIAVIS